MGRHNIKGRMNGLDLRQRIGNAPVAEDLRGVAHLNHNIVLAVLVLIGNAGDIVGHPETLGQDGDLESADLVGDMAVPGDGVRR